MLVEYQTKSTLNPALWKNGKLRPKLREGFMRIAEKFVDFLEVKPDVYDIILIGSNANYNWTSKSDIDIHVVVNYMEIGDNLHLVKNYMMAKKSLWNHKYPLKLKDMDIELYAQDINQELHTSVGEYSILHDKWIRKPNPDIISIDDDVIEQKAKPLEYEIEKLKETDPKLEIKIHELLTRLYKMRQTGLETEGEYSLENLAFKRLRNSGHIARLKALLDMDTMNQLQLEQVVTELKPSRINKAKRYAKRFIDSAKTESRETQQAALMLINHVNGTNKLSPEEWKWVRNQLKDVVKMMGLTAMAIAPGGTLVALLLKALKADKYILPSAFKDDEIVETLSNHITKKQIMSESDWDNVIQQMNGVTDPAGQWKHPGKCTMIPSNSITMKNVSYDVFGIDDTGHSMLMKPEQEYQFPGTRVFEIPNTAQWKTLIMQLQNKLNNGAQYAE